MLGKRGRFVHIGVAAQAPWEPELLGGRTEDTTASPLPPSTAVWLFSLSKDVLSSGGLRESAGGFASFGVALATGWGGGEGRVATGKV